MKLLWLAFLVGLTAAVPAPVVDEEFLEGYNKFTGNLYKEIMQTKPGNFLLSPISVDILLSLAEYGSAGETSKQLLKALHLPENKEKIREAFTSLTPKLNTNEKYTLSSANKIYVQSGINLLDDFKKIAEDVYSAGIENINFGETEKAANIMNKWIEERTHDKIKDLVNKDYLSSDTRAVFLNALYFRGNWVTKFNPKQTTKSLFHVDDKNTVDADLMEVTSKFKYYDNRHVNAQFLELPYDGEDVTLTIVLPYERSGLTKLEEKIDEVLSTKVIKPHKVEVKIPKFQFENKVELNEYLKNLGIVDAFGIQAQFPKITGEKLSISKVVQKARIEVDEEGTTAAVASYVDEVSRSAHVLATTEKFTADHPFIFILRYKSIVLFIGHYTGKE